MLMLIDKGYYDYDFEIVKKPITIEDTIKSDEEVQNIARRFGFGVSHQKSPKDMNAEELQEYAMKQEQQ